MPPPEPRVRTDEHGVRSHSTYRKFGNGEITTQPPRTSKCSDHASNERNHHDRDTDGLSPPRTQSLSVRKAQNEIPSHPQRPMTNRNSVTAPPTVGAANEFRRDGTHGIPIGPRVVLIFRNGLPLPLTTQETFLGEHRLVPESK